MFCDLMLEYLEHLRSDPQNDGHGDFKIWLGGDDGFAFIEAICQNIRQSLAVQSAAGEIVGRLGPGWYKFIFIDGQIGAIAQIRQQQVLVKGIDIFGEFLRLNGHGSQFVIGLVTGVTAQNTHLDLKAVFDF